MFTNLIGKNVLITGASAGIGAATVCEFAEATEGKIKLVLGARRVDKLEDLAKSLTEKYPSIKVHGSELDLGSIPKIQSFLKSIPEEFAKIDILVNNAGKALGQEEVGSISLDDIETVFATNVIGMIAMTQLVIKGMKERNCGNIIQLGSIAGRDTYPGGSIYCSTKAALKSFTDAMRKELISTKLRVIEIAPGNTHTEFALARFKGDSPKASKVYEGMEALQPVDIAELIVFACSRRQTQ